MVEIDSISDLLCNIKEAMKTHFYPIEMVDNLINTHKHEISDVNDLTDTLDDKSDIDHTHPIDDILKDDSAYPVENQVITGALQDKADATHSHPVESVVNNSVNPVQSKAVQNALEDKADTTHTHSIANINNLQDTLNNKADKSEVFSVDSSLSSTSTNPVQNKVINSALNNKASLNTASYSNNGLMSTNDKIKLDNVAQGATKNHRQLSLIITSPIDDSNQPMVTIRKGTSLTLKLYDIENEQYASNTIDISYCLNGVNSTRKSGGTITINLDPGEYPMYLQYYGSSSFAPTYRAILLKVIS